MQDLSKGKSSPIKGDPLGSVRLIKSEEPGTFENADRLRRAFQSNATAVTLSGTLEQPVVTQTIMRDMKGFFDRALGGSVQVK